MRILIVGIFLVFLTGDICKADARGQNQNLRNLVLNELELKFAGNALRTVLGSNVNSYRRNRGTRRFSGTFTIIEKDQCGSLDIRIDADVDLTNANGNGNRNRDYYRSNGDDLMPTRVSGNSRYAGQFGY